MYTKGRVAKTLVGNQSNGSVCSGQPDAPQRDTPDRRAVTRIYRTDHGLTDRRCSAPWAIQVPASRMMARSAGDHCARGNCITALIGIVIMDVGLAGSTD